MQSMSGIDFETRFSRRILSVQRAKRDRFLFHDICICRYECSFEQRAGSLVNQRFVTDKRY